MDRIDRMDRMDRVDHEKPSGCPPHGAGLRVESLVGRRLVEVVAAWQEVGGGEVVGPLDVWLIDDGGDSVHVTTGSDWCLIVEAAQPYGDYDLGASGGSAWEPSVMRHRSRSTSGSALWACGKSTSRIPGASRLSLCLRAGGFDVRVGVGICCWPSARGQPRSANSSSMRWWSVR